MKNKETWSNEAPICPHCGHQERDLEPHHYDEDTTDLTCSACDTDYEVEVHNSFSWSCRPAKEPSPVVPVAGGGND